MRGFEAVGGEGAGEVDGEVAGVDGRVRAVGEEVEWGSG